MPAQHMENKAKSHKQAAEYADKSAQAYKSGDAKSGAAHSKTANAHADEAAEHGKKATKAHAEKHSNA